MKRGFIIILLFVVLVGLCLVEDIYLKTNLEKLKTSSVDLLNIVLKEDNVNTSVVTNKISEIKEFWSTTEAYFCLVVNHINMEEVGEQISKMETYASLNQKEELIVEINLLTYYADSYQHIIVPNIQNIL